MDPHDAARWLRNYRRRTRWRAKAARRAPLVYSLPCRQCGTYFISHRRDRRYCSNACRQRGYRQRKLV